MKIELHEIPVRDVVNGYVDSAENGVVGYGGKGKNICQRELLMCYHIGTSPYWWIGRQFLNNSILP